MKAIIVPEFGDPNVMKVTEINKPTIEPDQVLIRVKATSVNYADIKSRYGKKSNGRFPFIPGIDAAGVIEEIGSKVQKLKVGQKVIAFPKNGSYAEYAVANEKLVYVLPENVDFETAAACPIVSFLSYKLLKDVARLEAGETLLVHAAAGGVGTTVIQLAKLLGAGQVIGTVGSEQKVAVAHEAGADHVINYEKEDFAQKVKELTNGNGVDIILDSVAGEVTEKSFRCLAYYGRLVNFGNSSGRVGNVETKDVHSSCRSLLGYSLGTTRSRRPDSLLQTAEAVLKYIEKGDLKIKIGRTFSLEEASKAHEWVESRQSIGKVILTV